LKLRYKKEAAPFYPKVLYSNFGLEDLLSEVRLAFVDWQYSHEVERARLDGSRMGAVAAMLLSEFESCIVVEKIT